jgi:hypothetical protein
MTAFFRTHLLGQSRFGAFSRGDALPPPSALTDDVRLGYLPGASDRREINRFTALGSATTWTSGVTASICSGSGSASNACQPNLGDMQAHFVGERLSARQVAWSTTGQSPSNLVAASDRNVSNFGVVQFRVAVNHTAAGALNPVGANRDFSVQLTDASGATQSVRVSDYSDVLYYPPGAAGHRKNVMNTVRVPLDAFGNLDRTNITSVDFLLNGSTTGSLLISDLAFADRSITAAEIWHAASATFLL